MKHVVLSYRVKPIYAEAERAATHAFRERVLATEPGVLVFHVCRKGAGHVNHFMTFTSIAAFNRFESAGSTAEYLALVRELTGPIAWYAEIAVSWKFLYDVYGTRACHKPRPLRP